MLQHSSPASSNYKTTNYPFLYSWSSILRRDPAVPLANAGQSPYFNRPARPRTGRGPSLMSKRLDAMYDSPFNSTTEKGMFADCICRLLVVRFVGHQIHIVLQN